MGVPGDTGVPYPTPGTVLTRAMAPKAVRVLAAGTQDTPWIVRVV